MSETGKEAAPLPVRSNAGLERSFDVWWEAHGQFHRAGGGEYEKTFAYHAWIDSAKAERQACAKVCADRAAAASLACDAVTYYEADECEAAILERSNVE